MIRTTLAVLAWLCCAIAAALSQTSPPAVNLPWNSYVPTRIPDRFRSIIGMQGTQMIAGTNQARYNQTSQLALPFPFTFIDRDYPQGYTLRISPAGFISFNGATSATDGGFPYNLNYLTSTVYASSNKVLAVYWSDVQTNVAGGSGGIFYRVDGVAPQRVLTVEWRATGVTYMAGGVGNFQALLYERGSRIELFYGPGSLDRRVPATSALSYGAVVGIKNFGQPATLTDFGSLDAEKFLVLLNPDLGNLDTVAITRMNTVNVQGANPFQTVLYAYFESYQPPVTLYRPSKYFHYSFPTSNGARIGYRIDLVLDDIGTDTVWTRPVRLGQAYSIGANVGISARFRNYGTRAATRIPVRAQVYRGSTLVATRTDTAWTMASGAQGTTTEVAFTDAITAPITSVVGEYEVRVFPMLLADLHGENDTMTTRFYISGPNDLMPVSINEPMPNGPPLFQKYLVDVPTPVEITYVNSGTYTQTDARVGCWIEDASGAVIDSEATTVSGSWLPGQTRDVRFIWTPSHPGRYYVRAISMLAGDENRSNDTLPHRTAGRGTSFDVFYDIEVETGDPMLHPHYPTRDAGIADGRPSPVRVSFLNHGASDATDVPATVTIRDARGVVVYSRTVRVSNIVAGGSFVQEFPAFVPGGAGTYAVEALVAHPSDPLRANDTVRWAFEVKPRLSGLIRVGYGERFQTIQEARDSLFTYGVSGPITFELTGESYTIDQREPTSPALDFRGRIVGLDANNAITWRPAAWRNDIRITIRAASGIGIWYGQLDTVNPSGYMTWDGGANRALRFMFENTGARDLALPFYFGQGASNYAVRNVRIQPVNPAAGKQQATTLSLPTFTQSFNSFAFVSDLSLVTSAGIMLRNSAPVDPVTGTNTRRADTLPNQNNAFENNEISGFGYGIVSIGSGPLFVVGQSKYVDYSNTNNTYRNNLITNVGRGGIVVAYEKGSEISGNTIRRVNNTSTVRGNAVGIWATAGGNSSNNRGYSTDLRVERNRVSDLTAASGTASPILLETSENQIVSPANVVFRFPVGGVSNYTVRNNFGYNYSGNAASIGIGMTVDPSTRVDFLLTGNKIENNTIYNRIAGTSTETGVMVRGGASIRNNIIALTSISTTPTALVITAADYKNTVNSDYNLFWVPNGNVGKLNIQDVGGQSLPSPAVAKTLQQWRALTGLDMNSVQGDITPDFVSTTPGSEDLHIKTTVVGSLANNRGTQITGISNDIDLDPRGSASVRGYDIGADEFNGLVRNNDLQAEDITAPFGYRAVSGQFSDAEYFMIDSAAALTARVRNVGGSPMLSNTVTMTVDRWNGSSWTSVGTYTRTASVDVTASQTLSFGSFQPQSLQQLGMTDSYYGSNPNVTPLYRLRVTTSTDDNATNNTFEKIVRFYIQRSTRKVLVSVEGMTTTMPTDVTAKGNKLNSDTLMGALKAISWDQANGTGTEDYDLFERDKWPSQNLNFLPWKTIIWSQGEDNGGLLPEERLAIEAQLDSRTMFDRANLIIAGQEVARQHDVQLGTTNGMVADQQFVRGYLRSQYVGSTNPADYSNRRIQGVRLEPNKYELIAPTGVAGDLAPMPGILRATNGEGIAGATHRAVDMVSTGDSSIGIVSATSNRNVIYYAFDWRHAGRYQFEPDRSGAQRLLLAALDWTREFNGAVPVKLVSMNAFQSGRHTVTVDWQTASEVDVVRMEIERATVVRTDAGLKEGTYQVVDRTTPRGGVTKGASYRVTDNGVDAGEYQYRLVTVNADGQRVVEETRLVKVNGEASAYGMTITSNVVSPATNGVIEYVAPSGDRVRIAMYDATGRLVKVLVDEQSAGEGRVTIARGELPSGTYIVRMAGGGEMYEGRLSVEK